MRPTICTAIEHSRRAQRKLARKWVVELTVHFMATPQAMRRGPGAQNSKFSQKCGDAKHAYPLVVVFA